MLSKQKSLLFFVVLAIGISGCASYKRSRIDVRRVQAYPCHCGIQGIWFAADPCDCPEKAKQGFYVDVTKRGFYPVNLVFENETNDRLLILREKIELIDASGNIHRPVRSTIMFDDFEKNEMAYAILGFGIFSYMSAEEANGKMEADWREKEIPDQLIILPDRKGNGFVYFQLSEGRTIKGCKICLEAEKLETKEKVQMELTL